MSTIGLARLVAEAEVLAGGNHRCAILGHKWIFTGGSSAGCECGNCYVSINECEVCGDCDYGDNPEADEVRRRCEGTCER